MDAAGSVLGPQSTYVYESHVAVGYCCEYIFLFIIVQEMTSMNMFMKLSSYILSKGEWAVIFNVRLLSLSGWG